MAAAECIPVTIGNESNEVEDIKKLNGANGDHAESNGIKNGKTEDSATEEAAPETTTDNSNTESTEQSEKTGTPANPVDEEVCEDEPAVGTEEVGEYDERMNGHNKKDTECVDEVVAESNEGDGSESNDVEDGCATKRPADDGECVEEPTKKFCPKNEEAQEVNSE